MIEENNDNQSGLNDFENKYEIQIKGFEDFAHLKELEEKVKEISSVQNLKVHETGIRFSFNEADNAFNSIKNVLDVLDSFGLEYDLNEECEKALGIYEDSGEEQEGQLEEGLVPIKDEFVEEEPEEKEEKVDKRVEKKREDISILLEKGIVIGISIILLIVGGCIKKQGNAKMWLYMLSFAFAAYELIYDLMVNIFGKKYFVEDLMVFVSSLGLIYLGYHFSGAFVMLIFALSRAAVDICRFIVTRKQMESGFYDFYENVEKNDVEAIRARRSQKIVNIVALCLGVVIAFVPPFFKIKSYKYLLLNTWLYNGIMVILAGRLLPYIESIALNILFSIQFLHKNGIHVSEERFFEKADVNTVAFDGTGVLLDDVYMINEAESDEKALELLCSIEKDLDNPIANRLQSHARQNNIQLQDGFQLEKISHDGIVAKKGTDTYLAGSRKFLHANGIEVSSTDTRFIPVYVAKNKEVVGHVLFEYVIRNNSRGAVMELHKDLNVSSVILTGGEQGASAALQQEMELDKAIFGATDAFKTKYLKDNKPLYVANGKYDENTIGSYKNTFVLDADEETKSLAKSFDGEIKKVPLFVKAAKRVGKINKQNLVFSLVAKAIVLVCGILIKAFVKYDVIWIIAILYGLIDLLIAANTFKNLFEP